MNIIIRLAVGGLIEPPTINQSGFSMASVAVSLVGAIALIGLLEPVRHA